MKRPLAYITAHWGESTDENMKLAAKYCRAVYDAGYQPICPLVMHSLCLRDAIPQEHKDDLDMSKDYLYRASLLVLYALGDLIIMFFLMVIEEYLEFFM